MFWEIFFYTFISLKHIIKGALWGNLRWQGPPYTNKAEQYETVSSSKVSAKTKSLFIKFV